ncbi:hypothetical protein GQ602_003687 [Ophiocordyceps camponoti-floridani]|uniref:GPR1/FUN34/YaaH-class plasma membrane protein n=1 Tax=Ophiocordyceps camponoti-floridani TaxID=2030778 RepID=A0A8H4VEF9_9HYPO|nr:hypothetical protein GQ602_003687 [Ophiocordyceps camponoti-floridani]
MWHGGRPWAGRRRSVDAISSRGNGKERVQDLEAGQSSRMAEKIEPVTRPATRLGSDAELGKMDALQNLRTAQSVSMSPELFEKLYLTPVNNKAGKLRMTFGNPAPLGLAGFIICLSPLSFDLMGWRGSGGQGNASLGAFWFQGGVLMVLASILEWVLGNTFPAVTFGVYGTFWWGFAAGQTPAFAVGSRYAPGRPIAEGLESRGFEASNAWWLLFMAIMSLLFFVCALRTNIMLCTIYACLTVQFLLQCGSSLLLAENFEENRPRVRPLVKGAGALAFVAAMAGWYLLVAELLAAVDFPYQLNVGHLSNLIKGKSQKGEGKIE